MLGPDQNGNSEDNTNIDNLLVNKQGLYINITGIITEHYRFNYKTVQVKLLV